MPPPSARALVLGGGIVGASTALELRARGWGVTLVDPAPLPAPLAESTDISKVVRADYGADLLYTELAERAIVGWRAWSAEAERPFFHETGVAFLRSSPMREGTFEGDSFRVLSGRGWALERLEGAAISRRFPAFHPDAMVDGYVNALGGFVEASAAVRWALAAARSRGVQVLPAAPVRGLARAPGRVLGARVGADLLEADLLVVATGGWTADLVPELAPLLSTVGQPVFHFSPVDGGPFTAPALPVFGADISTSGTYGFPLRAGVVKVARHGDGRAMHPGDVSARAVTEQELAGALAFLSRAMPALAAAPLAETRVCVYGQSADGHPVIAPSPAQSSLVVACGGSGHIFKFGPVLGGLVADAAEGKVVPRFAWRTEGSGTAPDAARAR